jgi:hypothetical protein
VKDARQEGSGSSSVVLRSLRSTVGRESTTFGFSILVTVAFALVQSIQGPPSTAEVFGYASGAVLSFTVLGGLLSRGFRRPMPQHATQTMTLGTSLNLVSVLLALATAWAVAEHTSGLVAWAAAILLAGLVYLLLEGLEESLAERTLVAAGDPDAREVTNQDS